MDNLDKPNDANLDTEAGIRKMYADMAEQKTQGVAIDEELYQKLGDAMEEISPEEESEED